MLRHYCFALVALGSALPIWAQGRPLRPDDLFRIESVGAIAWAPGRERAAVEITRPGKWIDPGLPTAAIYVVDIGGGAGALSRQQPDRRPGAGDDAADAGSG